MTSLVNKVWLAVFALLLGTQLATAQQLITYFHDDAAGSPVAATDANGNVVWREDYAPYGERRTYDLSGGNNRNWFIGLPHSDEYGLTYMGSRYYDSAVGRFMGVDPYPVTEPYLIAFNRYAYANNNPYTYKDPDGEFLNFVFGGAKAAIENAVIQQAEIALGLRTEFSWGELAFDTGLGVATSGLSTLKNAGRLGKIGAQMMKRADDAKAARALPAPVGILTKPSVSNPRLQNTVNALFQDTDLIAGGTAGAVRHELRTGTLVGGTSHITKANQRVSNLQNVLRTENLSTADRNTAQALLDDLQDALRTQREFK